MKSSGLLLNRARTACRAEKNPSCPQLHPLSNKSVRATLLERLCGSQPLLKRRQGPFFLFSPRELRIGSQIGSLHAFRVSKKECRRHLLILEKRFVFVTAAWYWGFTARRCSFYFWSWVPLLLPHLGDGPCLGALSTFSLFCLDLTVRLW